MPGWSKFISQILTINACISFADVSGGYSPSVFSAIQTSIDASKALGFSKSDDYKTLDHHESLYMATLGGARGTRITNTKLIVKVFRLFGICFISVLYLDDKIGNFKVRMYKARPSLISQGSSL